VRCAVQLGQDSDADYARPASPDEPDTNDSADEAGRVLHESTMTEHAVVVSDDDDEDDDADVANKVSEKLLKIDKGANTAVQRQKESSPKRRF